MTTPYEDPFAGSDRNPALSFKNAAPGTTYVGVVTSVPKLVQSRDFESGEPATWPDGNPKMSVVTEIEIAGATWSVWAAKPSAMYQAFADAQKAAGARIEPGGTLTITFTHEVPNEKNPRLNAAKQYRVHYAPRDAFGEPATVVTPPQPAVVAPTPVAQPVATPVPVAQPVAVAAPAPIAAAPAVDPAALQAALANLNPEALAALVAQQQAAATA